MADESARDSAAGIAEFSARRFTTDTLAEHKRLPTWREAFGRAIVNVDIEPLTREPFRAEATMRRMPGLRALSFKGSAMHFRRTRSMVAAGDDSFGLVIGLGERAAVTHRSAVLSLEHGEACPVLSDEPAVVSGRSYHGLLLPRAPLAARVKNVADTAGRHIPRNSDALRLLIGYLDALPEKLTLASPQLQRTMADHVYDLVALSICPDLEINENSSRSTAAARLEFTLAYIETHFDRPGLTISAVARDQNISPRYLQRLLETTGSTFSERVHELRLQRAYARLADAQHGSERISDIALYAGFSDIAHFNRSFRRRFGDAPRGVRAAAKAAARD